MDTASLPGPPPAGCFRLLRRGKQTMENHTPAHIDCKQAFFAEHQPDRVPWRGMGGWGSLMSCTSLADA
jgi:hypothetical protein